LTARLIERPSLEPVAPDRTGVSPRDCATSPRDSGSLEVALLTGGWDTHYAYGLATALLSHGVGLDIVAGDDLGSHSPELQSVPRVRFLNLRGQRPDASFSTKIFRILLYYLRLVRYSATARPRLFHILWNNKFEHVDRTILMLYYKLLGKKILLTVHNVNRGRRDSTDTAFNRLTLRLQYRLADALFVHTDKMRAELAGAFGVREDKVTIIPFGVNNAVPDTDLTAHDAKKRLGITERDKVILFFGNIAPYKGLEYLLAAFRLLSAERDDYCLIVAGRPKGPSAYWTSIQKEMNSAARGRVIQRIAYIPDEDIEIYFKAADVLVLPYTEIFQSGVLFLGYHFGLPVIAADVGSLRTDIVEGTTGFIVPPRSAHALAHAIERYFSSPLFNDLANARNAIRDYAGRRNSWDTVGLMTRDVYGDLLRS
jgi:D-inositol-3-phosphate glycosyltransferase